MYGKIGGKRLNLNIGIDGFCVSFRLWGHRVTVG